MGATQDIGNIRFLVGDCIMRLTQRIVGGDADPDSLDAEIQYLDDLAAYYTEQDEDFGADMKKAAAKRRFPPGRDSMESAIYRQDRFRAIVKSCCRRGVLLRTESAASTWDPTEMVEA